MTSCQTTKLHSNQTSLKLQINFELTPSGLLIDGLAPKYKSYIWALSKLAFVSIDLYLTGAGDQRDQDQARVKRVCSGASSDGTRLVDVVRK